MVLTGYMAEGSRPWHEGGLYAGQWNVQGRLNLKKASMNKVSRMT